IANAPTHPGNGDLASASDHQMAPADALELHTEMAAINLRIPRYQNLPALHRRPCMVLCPDISSFQPVNDRRQIFVATIHILKPQHDLNQASHLAAADSGR